MKERYYGYEIRFRLYNVPKITGVMASNAYWSLVERIADQYQKSHLKRSTIVRPMRRSIGYSKERGEFFEVTIYTRSMVRTPPKIFWIHP